MKLLALLVSLPAVLVATTSTAQPEKQLSEIHLVQNLRENQERLPTHFQSLLADQTGRLAKRQDPTKLNEMLALALGTLDNNDKYRPPSKVPTVHEQASPMVPGAVQKKIRYGPYRVPALSEVNYETQLLSLQGIALNVKLRAPKPCDADCLILSMSTSMEYDDGKIANNSNGIWLHHAVIIKMGPNVNDVLCHTPVDIVYESGNEKTVAYYSVPNSTVKSGYHLRATDTFILGTELASLDDNEKWVWVTITYDILEGKQPSYKEGRMLLLSLGPDRCGGGEKNPFGQSNLTQDLHPMRDVFTESSVPWKASNDGVILGFNGHLHDGGMGVRVYKDNKLLCNSTTHYAKTPMEGLSGSIDHAHFKNEHISSQDYCVEYQGIPLKNGDQLHFQADYNLTKHPGMVNNKGQLEPIGGTVGALFTFDDPRP